ncbi:hypothetical protein CHO01_21980 [Cellulomonas hominis]|uniref:Uncharacterized protein n=1 Tax=Cellulomonas hominis TaxID=156981 RepID=A0A511FD05_9CELL|nr:hypothetical protein [Cellulomonas hominis]MBB5474677.1 hypothetical protein [Cellulomonas hominis]NKY05843.1 hypothetical protein [Cellulomonas hominis]GEL47082.1 hypothetical protein CHO01_21980 [Cellulomonas hominis]
MPDAQPKPTAALATVQVREMFASEAERCGFDGLAGFDRWLAEHDAQVAARALRALIADRSDIETAVAMIDGQDAVSVVDLIVETVTSEADRIAAGEEP